ncbi:hypothetical protein [Pseudomonas sp. KU43P]|uniref:hypothetical protein n=1 Tax=Pseudomonas sp. KU43P TaxID=2487887 RepID=UPI0012AA424A|nr:hypothetical protein [Pseudomonas sp. KU43P]BBH48212.1 hypothetical protein KU43P_46890 [Pseudomonas sp. KU43P]
MDPAIQSTYATSFRGKLYAIRDNQLVPLRLSRSSDKWHWGLAPQDDWLMAGGNKGSVYMDFTFDSHTDGRLHYHISIPGRSRPKRLSQSLNNYLGFYEIADVTDYWKIEPLEQTDHGLVCHLRDHKGYRAGAIKDTPHRNGQNMYLLNTREGETLTFLLIKMD